MTPYPVGKNAVRIASISLRRSCCAEVVRKVTDCCSSWAALFIGPASFAASRNICASPADAVGGAANEGVVSRPSPLYMYMVPLPHAEQQVFFRSGHCFHPFL